MKMIIFAKAVISMTRFWQEVISVTLFVFRGLALACDTCLVHCSSIAVELFPLCIAAHGRQCRAEIALCSRELFDRLGHISRRARTSTLIGTSEKVALIFLVL